MTRSFWPAAFLIGLAVAFFGSLIFAAGTFPHGYNWRTEVMSSLASPLQNPTAYRVASYGMAASGVFLSLLGLCLRASMQAYTPKEWTHWAGFFFVLGGVLLTISALLTPGYHAYFGLQKAHAKFAKAAGASFGFGMVLNLPALFALPTGQRGMRLAAILLAVVPVGSYLLCRVLLSGEVVPAAIEAILQPTVLGNLSFWEWVGSVSVYLYTALIVLVLRPNCKE
jgi:hypothetical protein